MKESSMFDTLIFAIALLGSGCEQNDDPLFDYNLKSAKVIETNNDFGLELFRTVTAREKEIYGC